RKRGLVGRVGEVLGLQTEPVTLSVGLSAGAEQRAVEAVTGVELDAGLGRGELHDAAGLRVVQARGQHRRAGGGPAQHPVMVVAAAIDELGMTIAEALADSARRAAVERRAG